MTEIDSRCSCKYQRVYSPLIAVLYSRSLDLSRSNYPRLSIGLMVTLLLVPSWIELQTLQKMHIVNQREHIPVRSTCKPCTFWGRHLLWTSCLFLWLWHGLLQLPSPSSLGSGFWVLCLARISCSALPMRKWEVPVQFWDGIWSKQEGWGWFFCVLAIPLLIQFSREIGTQWKAVTGKMGKIKRYWCKRPSPGKDHE